MADKIYTLKLAYEELNTLRLALGSFYEEELRRASKEQAQGYEGYHSRLSECIFAIQSNIHYQQEAQDNEN